MMKRIRRCFLSVWGVRIFVEAEILPIREVVRIFDNILCASKANGSPWRSTDVLNEINAMCTPCWWSLFEIKEELVGFFFSISFLILS